MTIIYEDRYLLALHKPAGLSVENGDRDHPSLERLALEYLLRTDKHAYARVAHRLDRPASGVVVLGKTKGALSALMRQFEERSVEKVYRAVLERCPPANAGTLRHWLRRDESGRKALVSDAEIPGTQEAILDYEVLHQAGGACMVAVRLHTGRFHQIRAQFAHIGCPIAGDVLYGAAPWLEHQIKLHAFSLRIAHPKTGEWMQLEAPAPPEW